MAGLKLYYAPGTCSVASHVTLEEAGADYEAVRIDFTRSQQTSPDYLKINPKGRVPALVDGDLVVTENPAIMRHIALKHPDKRLWPQDARLDARCTEWLAFMSSTVHVAFAHVRRPIRYARSDEGQAEVVDLGRETARKVWQMVEDRLSAEAAPFALGAEISVVDAYLLVFWNWGRTPTLGYDMAAEFPAWTRHATMMAERPSVKAVFAENGLTLPGTAA